MASETERLERETEATRAELEQTLGEFRARVSPGHLMDQAAGYFRNSSGRAYLHNLRDEVVSNPVPLVLIGAGITWLALSGAMARRGNGRSYGADHAGRQGVKETAQGWADEAGEVIADTGARLSEGAEDIGDRVSTAYDETVSRARQAAEGWTDQARATAHDANDAVREGVDQVRERAGELYERTASGFRRVASKASEYGQTAREAVKADGAVLNFCREQPLLVAGLGLAFGAAFAAMIPASRVERDAMGETSRKMQDRIKETATDTWHTVSGELRERVVKSEPDETDPANNGGSGAEPGNIARSQQPADAQWRGNWDKDVMGAREAATEIERRGRQGNGAVETEPTSGAAVTGTNGPDISPPEKQRT